jgi:hypothetical protein
MRDIEPISTIHRQDDISWHLASTEIFKPALSVPQPFSMEEKNRSIDNLNRIGASLA